VVELKENEINQLRAVVGLAGERTPAQPAPEVKKQDNVILQETQPATEVVETAENSGASPDIKETDTDLFVKIDEHIKIAEMLVGAKKEIKGIADTVLLLAKAEKLKAEAIERMETHLGDLDKFLLDVELKLSAPESLRMASMESTESVPADLFDLQGELNTLKEELSKLK